MGRKLDLVERELTESIQAELTARTAIRRRNLQGPDRLHAQIELQDLEERTRALRDERALLLDGEVERAEDAKRTIGEMLDRHDLEDAAFWLRRFFTSMAIGNAAALVAISAAVVQPDRPTVPDGWLSITIRFFSAGLVAAGAIPLILAADAALRRRERVSRTKWLSMVREAVRLLYCGIGFVAAAGFVVGLLWILVILDFLVS